MWRRFKAVCGFSFVVAGCAPALQLKTIDAAEERPANVLVFFRVAHGTESVGGLDESAFAVKEDDHAIEPGADRVLVNPDLRAQQATALLVDISGHPATSDLEALGTAVSTLVARLGSNRHLAIYGVDGSEQPMVLAPFGATMDQLRDAASRIPRTKPRDPSLDLTGGYVAALRALERALPPSNGPRIGDIVLLTRSADRASRVQPAQVADELRKTTLDLGRWAIAFGPDAANVKLGLFAEATPFAATTPSALQDAAAWVGDAIDARGRSYYLLSYCSPSRAGEHRLKLEVTRQAPGTNGRMETQGGSLVHEFRADGFGAGCTPSVPDGWKPDAAAPKTVTLSRTQPRPDVAGAVRFR